MLNYEACKNIAENKAKDIGLKLDKAYSIKNDYVFESSTEDCVGYFPLVVSAKTGTCFGLWNYLNKENLSMDAMVEVAF